MMWDYDVYTHDVQIGSTPAIVASLKEIEAAVRKYGQNGWELVAVEQSNIARFGLVELTSNL